MADHALPVRRAILPRLKNDPSVTALIPRASIYPVTVPANVTFPFIRYGASIVSPFRASGLDSSVITVAIHAFTLDLTDGAGTALSATAGSLVAGSAGALAVADGPPRVIASAEDQAHKMAAAIKTCLDDATLALKNGWKAYVTWTGSNVMEDGDEPGAWHAVVNLRVEVSG